MSKASREAKAYGFQMPLSSFGTFLVNAVECTIAMKASINLCVHYFGAEFKHRTHALSSVHSAR